MSVEDLLSVHNDFTCCIFLKLKHLDQKLCCCMCQLTQHQHFYIIAVRYLPHIAIRPSTLALNSLSHDFTKSSSSITAGRIPRDTLSTSQDTHLLSSGGSPCAPAAFYDETYLSNRLFEALSPAVLLEGLEKNKMCVEVYVELLQSDGGVLGAAITGASLALADAGVPMKDLVCGSTSAVIKVEDGNRYVAVADPTEDEILQACGVVTIAMLPNHKEVTVWDQFGKMPLESSSEAMDLARDGCLTMSRFVKNCLNPKNEKGLALVHK